MERYRKSIWGFVAKKIDDVGVVEEITNDVMMAGMIGRPGFRQEAGEFSWLCSIAKHKVIDYYRKKKLKTILFSSNPMWEEVASEAIGPERDALKNELKQEINKTLRELGEGYEKLLRLKYVEGLKIAEIAKLFKSSVKAIESKLIRAKMRFRNNWAYDKATYKENRKINGTDRG
ncbi:MAG: RNA polymerase sigma factor [Candidatus Shapirobacteria bacterium]|jgi:RNA polymerase sigma-70 factor (ECF subfamily)